MVNGLPITVPISPAAAAVIHTLDAAQAGDSNGRPFLDQLSLWVSNADAAATVLTVTITPPGGTPIVTTVAVPIRSIVQVFNETVLGGAASGLGGATISVQTSAGVMTAWGWFVRTGG